MMLRKKVNGKTVSQCRIVQLELILRYLNEEMKKKNIAIDVIVSGQLTEK